MQKMVGAILGLIALGGMGVYIMQAQRADEGSGPHYIVVDYDDYRIPVRCAQYTRDIGLDVHPMTRVNYSPVKGVTMMDFGTGLAIAKLDRVDETTEAAAFEALGISAEACARIQERLFDPDYDEYIGPGDDYGHARPEHDATPRSPGGMDGDPSLTEPPNDSTVDDPGADTEDRD